MGGEERRKGYGLGCGREGVWGRGWGWRGGGVRETSYGTAGKKRGGGGGGGGERIEGWRGLKLAGLLRFCRGAG